MVRQLANTAVSVALVLFPVVGVEPFSQFIHKDSQSLCGGLCSAVFVNIANKLTSFLSIISTGEYY